MILILTALLSFGGAAIPSDFVSIQDIDPTIQLDIRYFGSHNFLGRPVKGYRAPKCILTKPAAEALAKVQADLKPFALSLKVYDCYRPQMAVDDFVTWAKDLQDLKMKKEFYPKVDKTNLFRDGYIAEKSGHSRGSTVDLTLVPGLDMGTTYDYFDPLSHTANPEIGPMQKRNRLLLKSLMEKHGFKNLPEEWWHYTLVGEPYPDRFFAFEIE